MNFIKINTIITWFIALVWLVNGLFCKVLNFAPRHQQIVAKILGNPYAKTFTILIGLAEIIMTIWILSGYKTKLNTYAQILIIGIMNTLEFILVPDFLLWGKLNSLFAFLFMVLIYCNEFYFKKFILNKNASKP